MNRRRIHIVYEYGVDSRPHGSAYIRLLRPFFHPYLQDQVLPTAAMDYDGQPADVVIADRAWRSDVNPSLAQALVRRVRQSQAKLIYGLDDDFSELTWLPESYWESVKVFLQEADGVLVTTHELRARVAEYNRHIAVLPNALDERLLPGAGLPLEPSPFGARPLIIGCMGTHTHDADLLMILPALQAVCRRHPEVQLQFVGVFAEESSRLALAGLPVRFVGPYPHEVNYPLFMLWFSGHVHWDIALAPLQDTPFNRCKSDIKYLDYSAIGAAGVFSRVPAYTSSIQHQETGWLTDNTPESWVEALETLLTDSALRQKIANQATQNLYRERILARCVQKWPQTLDDLLAS
jgi:processive 1,2-diacylglycerol beta-glucosyltransferase